jgi:uncharacterized membrane protein YhaH (DUF805 family)
MTFFEAIKTCYSKYADFDGCASRSEYWWWTLYTILIGVALSMMGDVLYAVFALGHLVPGIAVTARRLHDTDRSGWLQLIVFIPLIGWILVLYWYVQEPKRPTRFLASSEMTA